MEIALLIQAAPLLARGAAMTMFIWICSLSISVVIGSALGMVRSQQLRIAWVSRLCDAWVFILRGIPFYVQLLLAYFVIPDLLSINVSAVTTACWTLGICSAAYVSQIIYAGINAIPRGQWEAARTLGFTTAQAIRYVIMPQLMRNTLPALTGELDQLLKSSSIVSTIGVLELTGAAKNSIARDMNVIPIYITIAAIYLCMSSLLALVTAFLERKYAYDIT